MHILIVEDDLMLGEGLQVGLRQAGFQPEWVKDGEAAWQTLRHESFSAVVLDLGLPKMDGLEVLKRLRSRGSATPPMRSTSCTPLSSGVCARSSSGWDSVRRLPSSLWHWASLRLWLSSCIGSSRSR